MRPLPAKQPSRAALLSVCGHAVLLALLMLVRTGDRPLSDEGSFINAVIVPRAAEMPTASVSEAVVAPETETPRMPAPGVPQTPPTPRAREQRVVSPPAPTVEPDEPAPPSSPPESESTPAEAVVDVAPASTEPAQSPEDAVARAEEHHRRLAAHYAGRPSHLLEPA